MFRYYSKVDPNRVTVVGEHEEGVLKIATARCSSEDSFCKLKGRTIAEGRLAKGKIFFQLKIGDISPSIFVAIAKGVVEDVKQFYSEKKVKHESNIPSKNGARAL